MNERTNERMGSGISGDLFCGCGFGRAGFSSLGRGGGIKTDKTRQTDSRVRLRAILCFQSDEGRLFVWGVGAGGWWGFKREIFFVFCLFALGDDIFCG